MKNQSNISKLELLLCDYAQAADSEKDMILEIMEPYIYIDEKVIWLYSKICDSGENEKDLYVELLMDLLTDYTAKKEEVL